MKLVRFGDAGSEKPGLVDGDGKIRDLSSHVADITGDVLDDASLAKLGAIDPASLPEAPAGVRLGAPVAQSRSFIAVGLNYVDHAKEAGQEIPNEPILFNKLTNCIVGPNDNVMMPKAAKKLDWELEIAFVIGKRCRYVAEADALNRIAGFAICNDVSERYFQLELTGQWMKGKCFETSG
ncbi:MAG: fumarylacetoacetate hydrolase family protein, partial [Pseudomonadota bacterium]